MTAQIIDLSTLAASDGFVIVGAAENDFSGYSVSEAGDVNGDGIDDLMVGARYGDDGTDIDVGKVYVIFGKFGAARPNINLNNLAANDGFSITGKAPYDLTGRSVSNAGDLNGDGIDDLIVGVIGSDDGGIQAGGAYVIFGKVGATRANIDLASFAASDGFIIVGDAAGDRAGSSVSNAGDINGDGVDDLVVGALGGGDGGAYAGEAYVIFGKRGMTRDNIDLSDLAAGDGFKIVGDAPQDQLGRSVSAAGDINGDGIDDIVVGSTYADDGADLDAGKTYIIFGQATSERQDIDLTNLAASDGFVIVGDALEDRSGRFVSNAGDINGDGVGDLIIGVRNGDNGGPESGEAYVIFGRAGSTRANIALANLSTTDGFTIIGDMAGDLAGSSVSTAGDVNGDGIDDLIVGAPDNDSAGPYAGRSYVIYGRLGQTRSNIDLTSLSVDDGFIIVGDSSRDHSGRIVSNAGDVNGDGLDDVIVGAPYGDDGALNAGEAYIIYGRLEAGALGGTNDDDFLIGTGGTDAIYGLAGDDLIYAGIGNDRLFGANGIDALFGEAGDDTLSGGDGQDKLDGGDGNDIVSGGAKGDSLRGGDGNDVLDGGADDDALQGGTGIDVLTGGEGEDKFRFRDGDTGNTIATADRITDLDQAQGERISLTLVDAIVGGADDSFTFIGTAAFGNVAGQLRYELIGGNTYVMGDTNGDGASDFMIRLDGALVLTGADFSL